MPQPATVSHQTLSNSDTKLRSPVRRQSEQFSGLARTAMSNSSTPASTVPASPRPAQDSASNAASVTSHPSALDPHTVHHASLKPPTKTGTGRAQEDSTTTASAINVPIHSLGAALTDTPLPSLPGSPSINGRLSTSGMSTPRIRATTLDVPGLTKSKVSPDGRISERDVGAKLVILMVGLPARGKSYIVKKIARYLNWLQFSTRIFNVGDRRRVVAGKGNTIPANASDALRESVRRLSLHTTQPQGIVEQETLLGPPALATHILVNGQNQSEPSTASPVSAGGPDIVALQSKEDPIQLPAPEKMAQDSKFFDPDNKEAKLIREQVAHETLDELLQYVLRDGGSVGILDATNHTQERRMSLVKHLRERDPTINVLFLESRCQDRNLLEANMRLKLSGPDYKGKDPVKSLRDFEKRVAQYEKKYQPLGDFEDEHQIPYCSMIDVGRKMITHRVNGFLSVQTITYLMNFNLAPRQIWLTRHGESYDNISGKIGGDSHLSPLGIRYSKALERFMAKERAAWERYQIEKQATTHFPPRPGDTTPPNPSFDTATIGEIKNFCVWTSMLNRSVETAQFFNDEEYDIKQMRMLDELNSGSMEGMTYEEIRVKHKHEYELRKRDKLQYRYPGPGGEGYLDIINRLRKVILEVERMTDHVLLICHRSIIRVLLAYFLGLEQADISSLEVPLGVVYMLEPRPYGVDFKAYRWNPETDEFHWEENYRLRRTTEH